MGHIRLVVDCSALEEMGLWATSQCSPRLHDPDPRDVPEVYGASFRDYDLVVCDAVWFSQHRRKGLQLANLSTRAILRALGLRRYPGNGRVIPKDYRRPSRLWCEPPLAWDGDVLEKHV